MIHNIFVIGGGVVGLSTALALARRGVGVTLADRGWADGASSWAGAGILAPLPPWAYQEDVSRLALAGMRSWPEWASELEGLCRTSPEFWTCGMEVRLGAERHAPLAWCRGHRLAADPTDDGLWLPEISQVRNPRLLACLRQAFIAAGGTLLPDGEVTGVRTAGNRVVSASTAQGDQHADRFVVATGAWAGTPLGMVAPVPNVRPMRGQMLLYPPGPHELDHIILDDGFYLVPRKDGHLLAGSTVEDAGFDATTTAEALTALHENACRLLPSLQGQAPIKSWAGLRPGTPDNLPVIDRHPHFENLWVHVGHFRYGVTMAPASSRLLVELLMGVPPFLDPSPYSWEAALKRHWPPPPTC